MQLAKLPQNGQLTKAAFGPLFLVARVPNMGHGVFIGCTAAPTQEIKMYLDFDLEIDTEIEVDGIIYCVTGKGYFQQTYEDSNPYLENFTGLISEAEEGHEVFAGTLTEGQLFQAIAKNCETYERVFEVANEHAYYQRIGFDN